MDYKEKYEEALERARKLGTIEMPIDPMHSIQEQIFPELAESEDEKIRKSLIDFLHTLGETEYPNKKIYDSWLSWLEKQKELTDEENEQGKDDVLWCIKQARQHAKDENEMRTCCFAEKWLEKQKPIEHFELKAHHWYFCHQAYCCRADDLTVKEGERFMCEKDGVVKGFIIKDPEKYFIEISAPESHNEEQKSIEVDGDEYGIDRLWHAERILEKTLGGVEGYQSDDGILEHKTAITEVKKLKYLSKKQNSVGWSEEDEHRRNDAIYFLETAKKHYASTIEIDATVSWLKSLKPNHWKPTPSTCNNCSTN